MLSSSSYLKLPFCQPIQGFGFRQPCSQVDPRIHLFFSESNWILKPYLKLLWSLLFSCDNWVQIRKWFIVTKCFVAAQNSSCSSVSKLLAPPDNQSSTSFNSLHSSSVNFLRSSILASNGKSPLTTRVQKVFDSGGTLSNMSLSIERLS